MMWKFWRKPDPSDQEIPPDLSREELVSRAPRFWDGFAKIKSYILTEVVGRKLGILEKTYGLGAAKSLGYDNGLYTEDRQFSFQNDCKIKYDDTLAEIKSVLSGIAMREYGKYKKLFKVDFPDLKKALDDEIPRGDVRKHKELKDRRYVQNRKVKQFCYERGLSADALEMGDRGMALWLPLLCIAGAELLANYLGLGLDDFRLGLALSVVSVTAILGCGFGMSWLSKNKCSVITRENDSKKWEIVSWTVARVIVACVFLVGLIVLIIFRSGGNPILSDPINYGLAVLNILGVCVAVVTFKKTGEPVHGYKKLSDAERDANVRYNESWDELYDHRAENFFKRVTRDLGERQAEINKVNGDMELIKTVCKEYPSILKDVKDQFDKRYKQSIKGYRDRFIDARNYKKEGKIEHGPVPPDIQPHGPITPLGEVANDSNIDLGALSRALDNFQSSSDNFATNYENWKTENNNLNTLKEVAKERITKLMDEIERDENNDCLDRENSGKTG